MFLGKIEYLATNDELRQRMESRARAFAMPDAQKNRGKILEIIAVK